MKWRGGILLLALLLSVAIQAEENDTIVVLADTVPVVKEVPKPVVQKPRNKDGTRIYADTAIYQGMNVKLDLATTILEASLSKGKVLSFEGAVNVRLKRRFYPTLELGYARAEASAEGGLHRGAGGFFRAGLDINALMKHPERLNALMVGVRVGTSLQDYDLVGVKIYDPYWSKGLHRMDFLNRFRADCWGEVVGGCQVQVWEGFQMGWYVRLKVMFTRKASGEDVLPYYIPGFGFRDDINWGLSYYIGYKF